MERELRSSLEVGNVMLILAQADAARHGKEMPHTLAELSPWDRKKLQDAATLALMSLDLDATVYAESEAGLAAHEEIDEFCRRHNLIDWRTWDTPLHEGDRFEMLIYAVAKKATQRWRQTLAGVRGNLLGHLEKLEVLRATDSNPALIHEGQR
jgi:hypothetical protein